MPKAKPLPCPFCGGTTGEVVNELRPGYEKYTDDPDARAYWYRCHSCGCHGGWAKSASGALRYWNMRTKA
jgi:Lar family restriction alleviation protein